MQLLKDSMQIYPIGAGYQPYTMPSQEPGNVWTPGINLFLSEQGK